MNNIVYLKQHVYIRYNSNPNQSTLVINAVTNHLLYNGNFYIDNLVFYDRTLSQSALSEDDYIDWRYERELAELEKTRRTTQALIISLVTLGVISAGTIFTIKVKKRKTMVS
jgi:hypothetical protein